MKKPSSTNAGSEEPEKKDNTKTKAATDKFPPKKETTGGNAFGVKLAPPKERPKEKDTTSRGSEVTFGVKLTAPKESVKKVEEPASKVPAAPAKKEAPV